MTGLLAFLLLLAPAAPREPVGGLDSERIEDPVERRVASLLAGEPVFAGIAAVVPLYARVPSEAGHGRPCDIACAGNGLRARFLVEDGRSYLRVANPTHDPVFLAAGTVFSRDAVEVAVARDAVIPGDFAALVPAAALGAAVQGGDLDLALAGALPPPSTGALLVGMPAFDATLKDARALRGEELYLPVLASGAVRSRRDGILALLEPHLRGFGGTAVGAVFLVGDRPVAAHVFARHDLFLAALDGLLDGIAVAVRDEELRHGRAAAAQRQLPAADTKSRALAWLRAAVRTEAVYCESYGAGFETLVVNRAQAFVVHAVVDQQRALIHAGFYAIPVLPSADGETVGPLPPPRPPEDPDETPTGFRERRPRPTVEDERRDDQNPNPGPHPGAPPAPGAGVAAGGAGAAGTDPVPARPR